MILLFTDGACSGNPGPGAWAWICQNHEERVHGSGYETQTTNNRMELSAALYGLMALNTQESVTVVSDSVYLVKGMEEWVEKWQKNGWINTQKKPVENQDLWKLLLKESHRFSNLCWRWVKGHGIHQGNIDVDNLARKTLKAQKTTLHTLRAEESCFSLESCISQEPKPLLWMGDVKGEQGMFTSFPEASCVEILQFKQHSPVPFTGKKWQIACLEKVTHVVKSMPFWYDAGCSVTVVPRDQEIEAYQAYGFKPKYLSSAVPYSIWSLAFLGILGIFSTLEARGENTQLKAQRHAYLKAKRVYWRSGPGSEHAVLWSYTCPGWPVFIRKRWSYWCQVEDVKGAVGWVHGNLLAFRRVVFVLCMKTPLRIAPSMSSAVKAYLQKGVLALCLKQEGQWFRVRLLKEGYEGWVHAEHVWNPKVGVS